MNVTKIIFISFLDTLSINSWTITYGLLYDLDSFFFLFFPIFDELIFIDKIK